MNWITQWGFIGSMAVIFVTIVVADEVKKKAHEIVKLRIYRQFLTVSLENVFLLTQHNHLKWDFEAHISIYLSTMILLWWMSLWDDLMWLISKRNYVKCFGDVIVSIVLGALGYSCDLADFYFKSPFPKENNDKNINFWDVPRAPFSTVVASLTDWRTGQLFDGRRRSDNNFLYVVCTFDDVLCVHT